MTKHFYNNNKYRFNVTFISQDGDHFDYVENGDLFDTREQAEEYAKYGISSKGFYEECQYYIHTLEEDYAHIYEELA